MERIELANRPRQLHAVALAAAAASAAAGGCSSRTASTPISLPAAQVSGIRLKARFLSGPDGLRIPAGWVDSQFGAPCSRQFQPDRCLPNPAPAYNRAMPLYSDANCTMPVIDLPPYCAGYFGDAPVFVSDTTLSPPSFVMPGAKLPAGTQAYILKPNCIPSQTLDQGYAAGPSLTVAAFAQFGAPSPIGAGRLQLLYRNSEDGAQELVGLHDPARGADCAPLTAGDGMLRCLPTDAVYVSNYADAACTQVAIAPPLPGNPPLPALAYNVTGTGSCQRERIYMLGATQALPTVYQLMDGGCTSIGSPPGNFVVGNELAPETFEPLTVREVGTGRIREQVLATADGTVVGRGYGWRDTRFDAAVYPDMIDGGRQALLPVGAAPPDPYRFYSDSACTQSEPLVESLPDACTPAPRYATAPGHVTPDCGATQVFPLGQPVDQRRVYTTGGGSCALDTTMATNRQLLPPGAALDASTFVTVTVGSE